MPNSARTRHLAILAVILAAGILISYSDAKCQSPADSVVMAVLQRFKADTIYHIRLNPGDSTLRVYMGDVALVRCRYTVLDQDDIADYQSAWVNRREPGWQSVEARKVWSGRPAVSDTVVEVVSRVSKVNPELISRVMPRRFVADLTAGFVLRVMTFEGVGEERSFREKMISFTQNWIPFMRQPHLDVIVSEKDAQTLYYALEPGTPIVLTAE